MILIIGECGEWQSRDIYTKKSKDFIMFCKIQRCENWLEVFVSRGGKGDEVGSVGSAGDE
ncbi:unnamed protein product [Paramecium octaurelia]|uniref:Uncharacterized protein n=1 Tax=Paramecium octaurelia TaxID=43137 RepID=A0A8S1V9U9_PAROT|nr:unnamed protein product [Paramecium octaurelia]